MNNSPPNHNSGSKFWARKSLSDLVINIFNCSCGTREMKDEKVLRHSQLPELQEKTSQTREFSQAGNMNPSFQNILQRIKIDESSADLSMDEEDEEEKFLDSKIPFALSNEKENHGNLPLLATEQKPRTNDYSYLYTERIEEDELKSVKFDDKLSTNSKKISKHHFDLADSHASKRMAKARKSWQPHEDKLVLELIKELGTAWAVISKRMGGTRTGKQIRDRYLNKLDPKLKNNAEWTKEEDALLVKLYKIHGKKWREISKNIPGRCESMVKNRVQWRFRWMLEDRWEPSKSHKELEECGESSYKSTDSNSKVTNSHKYDGLFSESSQQNGLTNQTSQDVTNYSNCNQNNQVRNNLHSQLPIQKTCPQPANEEFYQTYQNPPFNSLDFINNQNPETIVGCDGYYQINGQGYQGYVQSDSMREETNGVMNDRLMVEEQQGALFDDVPFIDFSDARKPDDLDLFWHHLASNPRNTSGNLDMELVQNLDGECLLDVKQPENQSSMKEKSPPETLNPDEKIQKVEVLKQRLADLEYLMQMTYQEIFKAADT